MKHILEVLLATILILIISPILLLVSIFILLNMGRPIFFLQDRPGLYGRVFKIVKFRTMTNPKADEDTNSGKFDSVRLTKLGAFLRKTSLDELPELINIVCGEMSFVGPRPLKVKYLPLYNEEQRRRHNVRPGITGWAQINGRNQTTWPARLKLDVWYVDNQSLLLDIKIIFQTVVQVFRQDGISAEGYATMPDFTGKE